jgi:glucose-1-phosphate thymidylyltransferase
MLISSPSEIANFQKLFGNGEQFGISIEYGVQAEPKGIAQGLLVAEKFITGQKVGFILGDNLFHGHGLGRQLAEHNQIKGAQIFAYEVANPQEYGVIEFSKAGKIISLSEKPKIPKSRFAVPGLYFYDASVFEFVENIEPSERGELEITTLNEKYLQEGLLNASILPRGTTWFDTGTFESLQDAGHYVRILESRQNLRVACLEEISWRLGWITTDQLHALANSSENSGLQSYLLNLIE